MKATMVTIWLATLLVFGSTAQAMEIPGGIVYSDGKNAIYQEFATSTTTNLTADLKDTTVKVSSAVSEDGLMLVWLNNNKIWFRRLPDGEPYLATMNESVDKYGKKITEGVGRIVKVPLPPIQKSIKNLMLSPEGTYFSLEYTETGKSWVQIEPGKNRPSRSGDYSSYPKYSSRADEHNAITVFYSASGFFQKYGNTGFYPPKWPIRVPGEAADYKKIPKNGEVIEKVITDGGSIPNIRPGLIVTVEDAHKKFSIKRDANFLSWQKTNNWQPGKQLCALIYRTADGWGPIEIRDPNMRLVYNPEIPETKNPGVWEIPISLKDCKSLGWKPDGSLTYLSEGRIFSIDGNRIMEGIKNSGIAKYSEPGNRIPRLIPSNNVFTIKPEPIAEGIDGDCLHWVANDTFLFRGKENGSTNIYSWHKGWIEKLCPAPEVFSYCDQSPFSVRNNTPGIASNKDRASKYSAFFIGSIKTRWSGKTTESIVLWIGKLDEQQKVLEFAFPTEINIEAIKDPSGYSYQRGDVPRVFEISGTKSKKVVCFNLTVPLNQIVILKLGNKYAIVRPLTIENEQMTYEWKYWSESSTNGLAKNKKAEPNIDPLRPISGVSNALEAPPWRYDITPPEFFITVEDIKIVWNENARGKNVDTNKKNVGIEFQVSPLPDGNSAKYISLDSSIGLESIIDPSKYQYATPSKCASFTIGIGSILLLKVDDKYVAIRPISVSQKYRSFEEMQKKIPSQLLTNLSPKTNRQNPSGQELTYEWKYWPAPPRDLAKTDATASK